MANTRHVGLFLFILLVSVRGQSNCKLKGSFSCEGGALVGLSFGDDSDDDFFQYFASNERTASSPNTTCAILQNGDYHTIEDQIIVNLDKEECEVAGFSNFCFCGDQLQFTASNNCTLVTTTDNDICTPVSTCSDEFMCPNNTKKHDNPNSTPIINGCGPSSLPFTGPSFSFEKCCAAHDICYGTCGTSKLQCDNDFYSCMACSCTREHEGFVTKASCLEIACIYYQGVDEFGCNAFEESQKEECICVGDLDTKKQRQISERKVLPPNKFGTIPIVMKKTQGIICTPPFSAECEADFSPFPGIAFDTQNENLSYTFIICNLVAVIFLFVFIIVSCYLVISIFNKSKPEKKPILSSTSLLSS